MISLYTFIRILFIDCHATGDVVVTTDITASKNDDAENVDDGCRSEDPAKGNAPYKNIRQVGHDSDD